jgi:hypothetical protein
MGIVSPTALSVIESGKIIRIHVVLLCCRYDYRLELLLCRGSHALANTSRYFTAYLYRAAAWTLWLAKEQASNDHKGDEN